MTVKKPSGQKKYSNTMKSLVDYRAGLKRLTIRKILETARGVISAGKASIR